MNILKIPTANGISLFFADVQQDITHPNLAVLSAVGGVFLFGIVVLIAGIRQCRETKSSHSDHPEIAPLLQYW